VIVSVGIGARIVRRQIAVTLRETQPNMQIGGRVDGTDGVK
jgi:hypothetical protein